MMGSVLFADNEIISKDPSYIKRGPDIVRRRLRII